MNTKVMTAQDLLKKKSFPRKKYESVTKRKDSNLLMDLEIAIRNESLDIAYDTADTVLVDYIIDCLKAYKRASKDKGKHFVNRRGSTKTKGELDEISGP